MHQIESSSNDHIEELKGWVPQQIDQGHAHFVKKPGVLIGDLDGLQDGASEISSAIQNALESTREDELERLIISLEIAIDHLLHHWRSINQNSWPLGEEVWAD